MSTDQKKTIAKNAGFLTAALGFPSALIAAGFANDSVGKLCVTAIFLGIVGAWVISNKES